MTVELATLASVLYGVLGNSLRLWEHTGVPDVNVTNDFSVMNIRLWSTVHLKISDK